MKRLVFAIVATLLVQVAPQPLLAESQALKLDNPNFDGNLSGWEQVSFPPQNKDASFEVEKNGWNGSNSAKISSKGRGGGSLVQMIRIEGFSSIRVSGQVKGDIANGFAFIDCVMITDDQPKPPFPRCEPVIDGKSVWTKVEGVFQVSMGTKAVRISLTVVGDGSALFDEVTVVGEKGQPQFQGNVEIEKNFVPDPGFEEVATDSFVRWTKVEGTGRLSVSTDPFEGKHCARIENDSDKPFRIATDITITEGQPPFGMVGRIRAKGVKSAYVTIEIPPKGGGGGRQKQPQNNPRTFPLTFDNDEWTKVSGIFGLPQDISAIRIQCVAEGAGTVWFDDVRAGTVKRPDSGRQAGEFEEFWIENPLSKVKLATHVFKPLKFDENKRYPAIFVLPGGNGYGTQLEKGGLPTKLANELGAIVTVFDPDGRGLTKDGADDTSGEIHQAGFNAVVKEVSKLLYVDRANIGFYTMSFGIILGACTAGRYADDPPVKFILDWEGPDGHLCQTNHVGKYDMDFWAPREASDWIRKYPGTYVRLQSEKDHVQKTNDHALRMINAATNKAFGGDGKTVFSRVNMKDGQHSNPPNITYRDGNDPIWMPESQDRKMDEQTVEILKELIEMKPEFAPPQKPVKSAVKGRSRLGFLNPYGYPKYSKDYTKKYFDALGVKNEDEFHARISQELEPLGPTVSRIDFHMWAGDEWRQKFASLKLKTWEEVRFLGTLNFRDPGDPVEIGKRVAQVVEYYDGDGDSDNPFGVTIKDWQIENEVNMKDVFWKGTPEEYASHLKNCAKAAKTADPSCQIVLAGEACDIASDTYPRILKALDHRQAFDAVDIHVYSDSRERDAVARYAGRFRGYLKGAGFENDIPMWMTEFGVTTGKARSLTNNDENVQASTFAIRAIQAASMSFEGSCYISLVDLYPDSFNKDIFDRMGLISSGLATRDKAWAKRKIYWTCLRLSEMLSMVSFDGVEKVGMFGDSISTYKFPRPGLDPIVFAYIDRPDSLPKDKPNLFTQPFTYYPVVASSPSESADWNKGSTVLPGDRNMAAKFVEDLLKGPVAIVMGETSSIASRFGVYDTVLQTCMDETSCSPYYTDEAIKGLGTNWMLMRPRLDFLADEKAWVSNDVIVSDMTRKGIEPIIDLSSYPGLDNARLADASRQIAERYDSDGLKDVFGSFTANRFRLAPSPTQSSDEFASQIQEISRAVKLANRNAILIVGGENPDSWWKEVFSLIPQAPGREKKPFDLYDLPAFASVAGDQSRNHKALLKALDARKKMLDDAKLGNIGIATMQLAAYSGASDGKPDQSERDQAVELAKLYAVSCASKSTIVGLDGRLGDAYSLFRADSTKKMGYYTLSKISQALSSAKNTGRIIPGDEDFGAKYFERTTDGLWVTRFGLGPNSIAIGWIDADKPPMFSSQDYGLPFTTAIELEYLVPEEPVKGLPVFRKLMIGGQNGKFTIPTDRLDPFVIRPTGETIEPLTIALNPPELELDPGQTGTVRVKVMGCKGKVSLSFPSTRTLPIEALAREPDENGDFTLKVSADSSNLGKSIAVKITAICENGEQATADLTVNVSGQSSTRITLWVGRTTALINGNETTLAVPPTIVGGKTLVPVRFISEAFGAKVVWDQKEQRIELIFGLQDDGSYTKKVTLWIGKKTAQADYGSKLPAYRDYTLDVAPMIMSGTTMVPIRFLSDVLGAKTQWNGAEKRIDITWTPF